MLIGTLGKGEIGKSISDPSTFVGDWENWNIMEDVHHFKVLW